MDTEPKFKTRAEQIIYMLREHPERFFRLSDICILKRDRKLDIWLGTDGPAEWKGNSVVQIFSKKEKKYVRNIIKWWDSLPENRNGLKIKIEFNEEDYYSFWKKLKIKIKKRLWNHE